MPDVVAVDIADAAGGYLVMTECPGTPWPQLAPPLAGSERDELRAVLSGQVARLHTITGTGFGYPSGSVGPLRETWRAAFLDMVDAVLADAQTFAVTLPAADRRHPGVVQRPGGSGLGISGGAGGAVTFDIAARQRLSLYRAYLYLIMWVETAPRQFGQEFLDQIHGRVFQPLAAIFGDG